MIDEAKNTADNSVVRILHISSARRYGGVEHHMAELCRGLQSRGHEVFVALRPTNEWQDKLSFLPEENIFHVSIRNPFGVLSGKRIASYVSQNQIDVVHAHLPRDYFPGSLACNLAKSSKFVLSRHLPQPLKPFNRFALTNLSKAIAISEDVESSLRMIFPAERIASVPAGVDTDYFRGLDDDALGKEFREFHHVPSDAVLVTMIGDLTDDGGQKEFIFAANEIVKTISNAHFALIGTDPTTLQSFRRDLVRLTEVMNLAGKFLWLDHTEDSLAIASASDILVPSLDWKYPGREVLEAICLGTPVLMPGERTADTFGSVAEAVIQRPEALTIADAVCRVNSDRDLRERIVEQLQNVVSEKYSIANTVAEIEKLYLGLTETKRNTDAV